jgi:hypothetical protein
MANMAKTNDDSITLVHADGQQEVFLGVGSNIFSAQLIPAGHDLLVVCDDDHQALVVGYFRNRPHPVLIDASGNRLDAFKVQALTARFTKALQSPIDIADVIQVAPSAPNMLHRPARNSCNIRWGEALVIHQDHLLSRDMQHIPAANLLFRIAQTPENVFVLGDYVVLQRGDTFSYQHLVTGLVHLQHDEITHKSGTLKLEIIDQHGDNQGVSELHIDVHNITQIPAEGRNFAQLITA